MVSTATSDSMKMSGIYPKRSMALVVYTTIFVDSTTLTIRTGYNGGAPYWKILYSYYPSFTSSNNSHTLW